MKLRHVIVLAVLVACATSPTGRKQLMVVPEEQLAQMGSTSYAQIKEEVGVVKEPATTRYVECVTTYLTRVMKTEEPWEVQIFDDSSVNAFALPGNKIGVHQGMLRIADRQGQLAAVIAHEIGHVIARHGGERVSQQLAVQGGLATADALMEDGNRQTLLGLLGAGVTLGVLLPYNRKHESEADQIGLELMARAGFDPRQAATLWQEMEKAGGPQPPEFLSTHPSHGSRVEHLQEHMPQALELYRRAQRAGWDPGCRAPASAAGAPEEPGLESPTGPGARPAPSPVPR